MPERTVAASLALALVAYASRRGVNADALWAAAGIDTAMVDDRDKRVPLAAYVALTRAAKAVTEDPAFPLRFGAEVDLSEVSIVGLISLASETMGHALMQLNRYGKLVIEVDVGGDRFENVATPDGLWMVDRRANPNDFPELTEITFARMIAGSRRVAPELRAKAVHVTHAAPAHAAAYEEILGAPVTFSAAWNAMQIDPNFVMFKVQKQPHYAFGILTRHADALLAELAASTTVRGRVEGLLLPILHTGDIGADDIARQLGMSRQTLYRRLKEEGATFEAVLDDLRRRLALDYLSARKASVNETAYLVGFSEPAAFSRAFKRWTGKSPKHAKS